MSDNHKIKKFSPFRFDSSTQDKEKFVQSTTNSEHNNGLTYTRSAAGGFSEFGLPKEDPFEYTKAQMDKAMHSSYQQGLSEGHEKAKAEAEATVIQKEEHTNLTATQVLNLLKESLGDLDEFKRSYQIKIAELCKFSVNKFCNEIAIKEADKIIESAIEKASANLDDIPHLVIKLNPQVLDLLSQRLEKRLNELGDSIEIKIIQDTTIEITECRIEWENTGINIDLNEKMKEIDTILNEYIKSL